MRNDWDYVKDSDVFKDKGFGVIAADNKGTIFEVRHRLNNELMGQVQATGI
jgi:hypothetical protein